MKVVLGATGARAEYKGYFTSGKNDVDLDLGGFLYADRIEYVAVILDIDAEAMVEITDISVRSARLTDDELRAYVSPVLSQVRDMSGVFIFAVAVISSTVIIFVILTKKRSGSVKTVKK